MMILRLARAAFWAALATAATLAATLAFAKAAGIEVEPDLAWAGGIIVFVAAFLLSLVTSSGGKRT